MAATLAKWISRHVRALREIAADVAEAENETRLELDKARNKMVPDPSSARSETGAIEKIEIYGPRDRRSFSVEEAVSWLARPMTGSAYYIELFDMPPPHSQLDAYDVPCHARR
jgi:hypothetical protein